MMKPMSHRMPKPAHPARLRAKGTDSSPTPVTMLITLSTAWVKVAFPSVCMENGGSVYSKDIERSSAPPSAMPHARDESLKNARVMEDNYIRGRWVIRTSPVLIVSEPVLDSEMKLSGMASKLAAALLWAMMLSLQLCNAI